MLVLNQQDAHRAVQLLMGTDPIAFDVETTGLWPWAGHRICGVALSNGGYSFYFPFRHKRGINLDLGLIPLLASLLHRRVVIGHNIAFDISMLKEDTTESPESIFDTMLAAYILNENEPNFKLKDSDSPTGGLADRYIQRNASDAERKMLAELNLYGIGKEKMYLAPADMVWRYAVADVELTYKLYQYQKPKLEKDGLMSLAIEYFDYGLTLNRMTNRGIRIDPDKIEVLSDAAHRKAWSLLDEICTMAGRDINPNSPKQVCQWLNIKSSTEDVLLGLKSKEAKLLVEYRKWAKVNSTYYDVYKQVKDKNNFIHTSLKPHGTVSGRLSCSNPNLQAVPRKSNEYKVKNVFIPRDGKTLFSLDLSQAEIRVGAHFSKEKKLIQSIINGADVHTASAELMKIPRDAAKRMNFGVIYGIGAEALSGDLGISESQARAYLNKYHSTYPGFRELSRKCEMVAMERGYIKFFSGRRRNFNVPEAEPHKAMSNLIQGTVAEMMRVAIQRVDKELSGSGVDLLLQVHDDLIGEIPTGMENELIPEIKHLMEDFDFDVPIIADAKITTNNWGEMTKWSMK